METGADRPSCCFSLQWTKMWQLSPCLVPTTVQVAISLPWQSELCGLARHWDKLEPWSGLQVQPRTCLLSLLHSLLTSVSTCRITSELPSKRSTADAQERPSSWDHTSPRRMYVSSVRRNLRWRPLRSTASFSSLMKHGSSWQRTLILKRSRLSCTAGLNPTYSTSSTSESKMILMVWFSRMGKTSLPHRGQTHGTTHECIQKGARSLAFWLSHVWAWTIATSSRTPQFSV